MLSPILSNILINRVINNEYTLDYVQQILGKKFNDWYDYYKSYKNAIDELVRAKSIMYYQGNVDKLLKKSVQHFINQIDSHLAVINAELEANDLDKHPDLLKKINDFSYHNEKYKRYIDNYQTLVIVNDATKENIKWLKNNDDWKYATKEQQKKSDDIIWMTNTTTELTNNLLLTSIELEKKWMEWYISKHPL